MSEQTAVEMNPEWEGEALGTGERRLGTNFVRIFGRKRPAGAPN